MTSAANLLTEKSMRRGWIWLTSAMLAASGLWPSAPAAAQPISDYPTRDLRVICNFPAGTSSDVFTRFFAERLSAAVGQNVKVDNRPKNSGLEATQAAATAKPDGYTILITPANLTLAAAVAMVKNPKFDPLKDFLPVTTLAKNTYVVLVDPKTPIKTIADLTAAEKSRKDDASFGVNSDTALAAAELYNKLAATGAGREPAVNTQGVIDDLLSGDSEFAVLDIPAAVDLVKSGKLRALAVTSAARSALLPDVPTMEEAGVKGYGAVDRWWGVFVPAKTPQTLVEKLEATFNRIVASSEAKQFLANANLAPMPGDAKSLAALLASEVDRWAELVKIAKLQAK
jgi:tripartite-type tricarboxylate transporter receptor subunit TctC